MSDPHLIAIKPPPAAPDVKRRRGAQPGNTNTLRHGKYSARLRAIRMAERQAEQEEERRRFEAWSAPILERCRLQHERILAELEHERAEFEAAQNPALAELQRLSDEWVESIPLTDDYDGIIAVLAAKRREGIE
jgi:hypothetical protein